MSAIRNIVEAAARARKIRLDQFVYRVRFTTFLANATNTQTIAIQSDSDFLWVATSLIVMTAVNTPDITPDMEMSVIDSGSGRQLQDAPVHVLNITGNGQWPFVLPEPKVFVGNGSIQVTVTDLSAVAKARVEFSFLGSKIFYTAGYDRSSMLAGI